MAKKSSKSTGTRLKSPHKSFKRTYREDYVRELDVPGMGQHIYESFAMFFQHWKLFLPLLLLSTILEVLAVNTTYETTAVFSVLIFLMIWLVTIFLVRHIKAEHKVTLRDGLYNAMTPLLSSLVVFVIAVIECIPIFLMIIAYSAAIKTEFLTMPFYALLFFVFAGLMLVLSGYLLSSSLIALIAVSAPGLYPWKALTTASELMMGRRIRFILRLIALILVLVVMWAVVILPLSALKLPMEVLSVVAALVGCFSAIYLTVYLYLYYRWLLDA
ncbi:hypothetical protein IJI28_01520 [Candidatus Saccharibacteria bacterium]|nr:hypothetical protein [Candidatus Saccharibacteria bacterium]